jgi:WXG100 family type VII secretion target
MNFTDGYIHIDYNHVHGAVEDMIAQSTAIYSIIENLEMELTELKASWIGDDAAVYEVVQAKWDAAVFNIKELLKANSGTLETIAENYRRQEQSGAQRWLDVKIGGR